VVYHDLIETLKDARDERERQGIIDITPDDSPASEPESAQNRPD
jgi:hypothetical protein